PKALLRRYDEGRLDVAFAVALLGRLRDQDPEVTPALAWLERRLAAQGTTADEVVALEHQRQAAINATVRNVITSMRLISAFDWAAFFESASLVDDTLAAHPGYRAAEFATRDRYRHAVEELARGSRHSEIEIARLAVRRAQSAGGAGGAGQAAERLADPGHYLIARGRAWRAGAAAAMPRPPGAGARVRLGDPADQRLADGAVRAAGAAAARAPR